MSQDMIFSNAPSGRKGSMGASLLAFVKARQCILNLTFNAMIVIALMVFCLSLPVDVYAQVAEGDVAAETLGAADLGLYYGEAIGLGGDSLQVIIARIIRIALSLLGIIAVLIVIAGGVMWMTAGGSEEKVAKAKKILINGAIGLAIILSAYTITHFVIKGLTDAISGRLGGAAGEDGGAAARFGAYAGASHLGKVIQDHYPERGARVPRNTQIIITFREPMQVDTLATDDGGGNFTINAENVRIALAEQINEGPYVDAVDVFVTGEGRTFTFIPKDYLGTANEDVKYTVKLTNGIKRAAGSDAFGGLNPNYEWSFTTNGEVDDTPPQVRRISPLGEVGPDRAIQITFTEAMSPVGLDVSTGDLHFVKTRDGGGVEVQGRYRTTNGYKSVTFIPELVCGQNACGQEKRCLPFNADITVLLEAAELLREGRATGRPGSGLTDASGNSLDGGGAEGVDKNGEAEGPPLLGAEGAPFLPDNYWWSFTTTDQMDLVSPSIISVNPASKPVQGGVGFERIVEIQFSEEMSLATLADNVGLDVEEGQPPMGFSVRMDEEEFAAGNSGTKTVIRPAMPLTEDTFYAPHIPYTVFDASQNCFYPSVGPGCEELGPANPSCCAYLRESPIGVRPGPAQGCADILVE